MRFETAIEHLVDNYRYAKSKVWIRDEVAWALYHTWKEADDRKDENCSEKPNNCEHITEDGVTCARYPACDDCPDNPLNKVKGSERLVKGSEQTEPQTCDDCIWSVCNYNKVFEDEPQTYGILFKGNLKEGDYKLIKTTNGWVLEGDIAYYGEPKTERKDK